MRWLVFINYVTFLQNNRTLIFVKNIGMQKGLMFVVVWLSFDKLIKGFDFKKQCTYTWNFPQKNKKLTQIMLMFRCIVDSMCICDDC